MSVYLAEDAIVDRGLVATRKINLLISQNGQQGIKTHCFNAIAEWVALSTGVNNELASWLEILASAMESFGNCRRCAVFYLDKIGRRILLLIGFLII
jgi:hypothetical protein